MSIVENGVVMFVCPRARRKVVPEAARFCGSGTMGHPRSIIIIKIHAEREKME